MSSYSFRLSKNKEKIIHETDRAVTKNKQCPTNLFVYVLMLPMPLKDSFKVKNNFRNTRTFNFKTQL